ncbi:MAG: SoxXA-binding protein [Gammaproteobacteria bacterium]|nr:SoxXA-binding protein [Gammaproteobacteria bacterium]
MKTRFPTKLWSIAILSIVLATGCAQISEKTAATKASPEATAAIASASAAIKAAKANKWIWRDTEKFAKQAQESADKGDNAAAIKLANKAKAQAEDAIAQYKYETANPRGL